jgi:hypothetical protein
MEDLAVELYHPTRDARRAPVRGVFDAFARQALAQSGIA